MLFTLGTGIGCGIVVDGMIIEGRHSHGAECGHIIIEMENGRLCSCGQYGHLEGYASATALVKRAREALDGDTRPSLLRELKHDEITSRAISKAADAGDELAYRLMRNSALSRGRHYQLDAYDRSRHRAIRRWDDRGGTTVSGKHSCGHSRAGLSGAGREDVD